MNTRLESAAVKMTRGLDNLDVPLILEAGADMERATELIVEAGEEAAALQARVGG